MIDLNLPIKLSLCIGLPSLALMIYYIQKNKKETEDFDNAIRSRQTIIELKVPSDCVRTIIGPGGSVIKEIQNKTGTRINFKDKNLDLKSNDVDRILLIRGSSTSAQYAELEIKRLILETPMVLTEEYYVPDYACGRIIGKGGTNIREMSQISNCRIKLSDQVYNVDSGKSVYNITDETSDDNFRKKLIMVTGNAEQIAYAKKLIIQRIKEEETLREKRSNKQNNKFSKLANEKRSSNSISTLMTSESTRSFTPAMPSLVDWQTYLDKNNSSDVYVTAICDPYAFWVQLINQDSIKIEDLLIDMNNHYSNDSVKPFNNLSEIKVGSLVSAKYDRKNWHRAEVVGFQIIDNKEKVDIYFVDYGDSVYADLDTLYKLENRFYDLPFQAIKCKLDDIKPVGENNWSDETIDFFEEITYSCKWKVLKLQVVDSSQKDPLVTLYDAKKNITISQLMVQKGFAEWTKKPELQETDL